MIDRFTEEVVPRLGKLLLFVDELSTNDRRRGGELLLLLAAVILLKHRDDFVETAGDSWDAAAGAALSPETLH